MKTPKFALTLALCCALALTLVSCANEDAGDNTTTTTTTAVILPEDEEAAESATDSTTAAISEENDGETAPVLEPISTHSAKDIAEAGLNATPFPPMMEFSSDMIAGLDIDFANDVADFYDSRNAISTQLADIMVVIPNADSFDAVKKAVEDYAETYYLSGAASFYPGQQEAAEATITGDAGGVIYLICHAESDTVEAAMRELIES
jgi:ABC-type amino acid transport substrate-binding protein